MSGAQLDTDTARDAQYGVTITPLQRGNRADAHAQRTRPLPAVSDGKAQDAVQVFRSFLDRVTLEADDRRDDAVAMTHAAARLDAIARDARHARDFVKDLAANAMHRRQWRRLTVEGVGVVEASTAAKRAKWDDERAMSAMFDAAGVTRWVDGNGEIHPVGDLVGMLLEWFRPDWRLTPLRDAGLDPDDFAPLPYVDCDDCAGHGTTPDGPCKRCKSTGQIVDRTPTLAIRDNRL